VANDIADFVTGKPRIDGNTQIVKPELRLAVPGAHVNVGWLAAFVRKEESAIWPPSQDCWQTNLRNLPADPLRSLWSKPGDDAEPQPIVAQKLRGTAALRIPIDQVDEFGV
jgi:hypothetical protein